jgi:ceramide glucosyltransferase
MDSIWLIAYLALTTAAVVQAALLALQAWEHRRYGRSSIRNIEKPQAGGRAMVLAPCKGFSWDLEENLRAVLRQDYRDYAVTFVVESTDDPACRVIDRAMAENPQTAARVVVAGTSSSSGQKVHNLLAATAIVPEEIRYLLFVDSDGRPRPEWLRTAIAKISTGQRDATTGYRWFMPRRATLANHLLASINCNVMSLLGHRSHYLLWGGAWATTRETFARVGVRDAWQGTLSDDLVASRVVFRQRLSVQFEPGCVVASPLDQSLGEMWSFIRRQYLITRSYTPYWWLFGVAVTSLANAARLVSLAALAYGLAWGSSHVWLPALSCALLYSLDVFHGWLIQDLATAYFPEHRETLRPWRRFNLWAGPLASLVHWLGMLSTAVGRSITWRGIRYQLCPGGRVAAIERKEESRAA